MTKKKARLLIIVLSCLLAAALSALAVLIVINITHSGSKSAEVTVKNNYINKSAESGRITYAGSFVKPGFADVLQKSSTDSITLTLNSRNSDESVPFRVTNMFPGDVETKVFRVGVSYKNSVTVHYKAAVRQGYEKLAEVLKCKIVMKDSGTVLYDGLMKDMPEAMDYKLPTVTQNTETELVYEISGYLETSVGNDYQEKDLIADFKWWVSDSENKNLNPPKTGDTTMTLLWAAIIGAAAMLLVVLVMVIVKKRRREMMRS